MSDSDKQALIDGSATVQTEIVVHNENLFDINEPVAYTAGASGSVTNDVLTVTTTSTSASATYVTIPIPNSDDLLGKTVTLSSNMSANGGATRVGLYGVNSNGSPVSNRGTITSSGSTTITLPSTYPTNCVGWALAFNSRLNSVGDVGSTSTYSNVRIEEGTPISLTETNSVIDWNHEDFRQVKEEGWIGQFVARQVTGNLHNLSDDFIITDKELELKLGVRVNDNTNWYSLGNFLVTKVTDDEVNDKTSFEALDYTKKFNKAFVDRLNYPVTALELAQDVCDQCGVALGSSTFKNSDYVIQGNAFTNNESCRDVMKAIGKLAFSWVRVDWDNKVYIDFDSNPFRNLFDTDNLGTWTKRNSSLAISYNDSNTINMSVASAGDFGYVYTAIASYPATIGKTYTISYKADKTNTTVLDENFIKLNATQVTPTSSVVGSSTVTATEEYIYLYVTLTKASGTAPSVTLSNIQIKEEPSQYETFGNNKYYNLKTQKEVFGPVDKVVIGYSAIEGERTYIGEENGTCVLNIFDNPLVFNQEQRAAIIESASDLLGFTYTPLNTLTVGHPWLKGNEIVRVSDMESVSHDTIPFDRTIQYFGHIKTLINSTIETKTNDNLSYKPEMVKNYERSEIYNDQINKQIGIIINEQSDTSNRLNETISTLDGTIQRVSNTETSINDITTTTQVSTGKNSLYIEDAIQDNAISYSVDGVCSQDGTPSPDSPVEVKTVPSIFNNFNVTNYTNLTLGINGSATITKTSNEITIVTGASSSNSGFYIPIANLPSYTDNYNSDTDYYVSLDVQASQNLTLRIGATTKTTIPIGPTKTRVFIQTKLASSFVVYSTNQRAGDTIKVSNIMISTNGTDYVPYGYYSKVKVTGKNILTIKDITNIGSLVNNGDGSITINGGFSSTSWTLSNPIILKANTTYILSLTNTYENAGSSAFILRNGSTNIVSLLLTNSSISYTPTQDIIIDTLRMYNAGITYSNYTFSVQLEQNNQATTYEPYKENQVLIDMGIYESGVLTGYYELCKIGDYKDTLSIDSSGNCVINKNIGKIVLNGSESWSSVSGNNCSVKRIVIDDYKRVEANICYSNYFTSKVNSGYGQVSLYQICFRYSSNDTTNNLYIGMPTTMTNDEFKTWLGTHNTDVYYVLATPETINLPNTKIPLFEGINHVTFVDDLETDTSITYYRNTPLSGTYATVTQLNEVSTEKTQEIIQVRNEVQTEITSTQASINVINETIENGVSKVNGTGYTFDSEGLKIEKTNQDVKSLLDNDGLAVSYKGTDILTVRSNGIEAENMTVRKFYVQRPIRMEKTKSISDGLSIGLGFYYVGEE